MGFIITGIDETILRMTNEVDGKVKRVAARLVEKAEEVRDLAKRMAPRDYGNLEDAIKVEGGEQGRDGFGRFSNIEVDVYVDGSVPTPQHPGHTVGDYAVRMHEESGYGLGRKSFEKQMADPTVEVGPKFLDRAAEQVGLTVIEDLQRAADT